MTGYIFNETLEVQSKLAVARMQRGMGAVLLLTGIPGGGKTSFARAIAGELGASFHKYQCAPDRERDLLYHIDVDGVLKREAAWLPGPAWEAFEATQKGYAVLLVDEADKTNPNFDAFLLELLEDFQFRAPGNGMIQADPSKLLVILTSNGRRKFRPEVLRRCQRIEVGFPERPRLDAIVRQLAGIEFSDKLLDLVIRLGDHVRRHDSEDGPSPKEMALCIVDLIQLREIEVEDSRIWRQVAASYLVKEGGPESLDKCTGFKWTRALMSETYMS